MQKVQYLVKVCDGCVMFTDSFQDALNNYRIVKRAILNREYKDLSISASLIKQVYNPDSGKTTTLLLAQTIIK